MKLFHLLLLTCICSAASAQSPQQQFWASNQNKHMLDIPNIGADQVSFAYSLRKLRGGYAGFAIRVRRSTDNAEADVAFSAGAVGENSRIRITSAGSGNLAVEATMMLSVFKGSGKLYVSIWYDQGRKGYHARQTTTTDQPELVLNSAGTGKPAVSFGSGSTGGTTTYLTVENTLKSFISSDARGAVLTVLRATKKDQSTFGYKNADNWRWSTHMNWGDNRLYFDAAEIFNTNTTAYRSVDNSDNENVWKQYSLIRGANRKVIRISQSEKMDKTPSSAASFPTADKEGKFYIGHTNNSSSPGFTGAISELILFPTDLDPDGTPLSTMEANQIAFWGL